MPSQAAPKNIDAYIARAGEGMRPNGVHEMASDVLSLYENLNRDGLLHSPCSGGKWG